MGIIKRQGIKQSIVNYAGVAVGILSVLFIYPREKELYGLFQVLYGAAILISPFILLGMQTVSIRFFPHFKQPEKDHNGFLFLLLSVAFGGFLLFLLMLPALKWLLLEKLFTDSSNLFSTYFYYLIPLTFLIVYVKLFVQYISNFQRIVVPAIFEQLLIKLTLPVLILFYFFDWISISGVLNGVLVNYMLALSGLVVYAWWLGELKWRPHLKFVTKPLAKEISEYAFYGILVLLGSQLAFRIDTLMVGALINLENAGSYAIIAVLTEVILKPSKAIIGVAGPIIAKRWEENDLAEIKMIYQKSSLNLLIVGIFIFLGIWMSIDALFSLMPNSEELATAKYVFFFLGLARLLDMGTSVNNEIINYSTSFRFNFYAILFLALFNVICNFLFIPKFQIVGAAIATLASIGLYNLMKLIFIQWKFKMLPFTKETLVVLFIAMISFFAVYYIPDFENPFIEIAINSMLLSLLFIGLIVFSKVSPDINELLKSAVDKLKKR